MEVNLLCPMQEYAYAKGALGRLESVNYESRFVFTLRERNVEI